MKRLLIFGKKAHQLDPHIVAILDEMRNVGPNSDEYPRLLAYLERLTGIKVEERRDPFNWDRVIAVVGNLVVVGFIVVYEQNHAMVSKGWSFLGRPRAD